MKRAFQLIPIPDTDSGDFSFPNAAPFGEDYPTGAGVMVYTDQRTTDLPEWISIYIAFRVLTKEFARPSDHQHTDFSEACAEFAEVLWQLAGL